MKHFHISKAMPWTNSTINTCCSSSFARRSTQKDCAFWPIYVAISKQSFKVKLRLFRFFVTDDHALRLSVSRAPSAEP